MQWVVNGMGVRWGPVSAILDFGACMTVIVIGFLDE